MAERIYLAGSTPPNPDDPVMNLITGKCFNFQQPENHRYDIVEISYSLGRICRFAGHVNLEHYSVAEHSVILSRLVPKHLALWALLHDASEAYTGDILRPIKRIIGEVFVPLENRITAAISRAFHLNGQVIPDMVGMLDNRLIATEIRDLLPDNELNRSEIARMNVKPFDEVLFYGWSAAVATEKFLDRFIDLK